MLRSADAPRREPEASGVQDFHRDPEATTSSTEHRVVEDKLYPFNVSMGVVTQDAELERVSADFDTGARAPPRTP
ncbi:MAG: hypothetical protein U0235_14165 [Polyangiaceae bacterium]